MLCKIRSCSRPIPGLNWTRKGCRAGAVSRFSSLFVYGTLMRGEANAGRLAGARFVGPARTVAGFRLVALQGYPGLCQGGGGAVAGELYLVDARMLASLDEFEGHPTLFRRSVVPLAGGGSAEAYLAPAAAARGAPVIPEGDWRRHRLGREGSPRPGQRGGGSCPG
jgi:gamma-glutamylaminecyclotransferase